MTTCPHAATRLDIIFGLMLSCLLATMPASAAAESSHAIAMQGEPAQPENFDHFPYVNPDAPQGGVMRYGVFGTFDNLNPVIVKGALTTARGIWADAQFGNLVFEPLMQRSADEPFSLYGLLAESIETDEDRTFIQFNLDPRATFSDGKPVRPEDLIFTTDMLRDHGRPFYGSRLKKVAKIEKVGERSVRFTFGEDADRELPLLLALMPVLPEHGFDRETFDRTTLDPVIGSGPYVIAEVKPGQSITYKRNPDYWGKDLPVKRGFDNYDEIVIEYYRDTNAQFEAFKKGLFHVYPEGDPNHWRTAYDFPAVAKGDVVQESFRTGAPANMLAFVFNTRRPAFADKGVRKALSLLFDFEWANKNLFYEAYARTASFFQNSALSSLGQPANEAEKALLARFPDAVEPEVMAGTYRPAVSDGSGGDRKILRQAVEALKAAGYTSNGGRMVGPDGSPLAFEILVQSPEQEKIALAYQRTLSRVGVDASVRQVDDSQYQARKQTYDYDMLITTYSASLSPGAEQVYRWGSVSRDTLGTFNYAGVADPAVDALIDRIVTSRTREDFEAAVRAYDRVLISGHYVVPLFHIGEQWLARWKFIRHPEVTPLYGYQLPTFWRDPDSY